MATWLEEALSRLQRGTGGLQAPTGGVPDTPVALGQGGTFDSSGPGDVPDTPVALGPGGTFDSNGAGTGPATVQSPQQDPLQAFLQGSMAYQQRTGHEDPLGAAAGRMTGRYGQSPVKQVTNDGATGLNRVAQLTSHGPRQGQGHSTFDLGNGLKANVYFDANGRRKTFVFHA